MKEKQRFWKGYAAGIGTVLVLVLLIVVIKRIFVPGGLSLRQEIGAVMKLDSLASLLQEYYLEDVDTNELLDGAYAGFADAVGDRYTRYYTAEEYADYLQSSSGTYAGIGVSVLWNEETGRLQIMSVNEGGAADKAGLIVGDEIASIDGENVEGTNTDTVVSRIKGEAGTPVVIDIVRDGEEEPIEITVTREIIEEQTVEYQMLSDGVFYIRITNFDEITPKQFREAIGAMQEQEAEALILDVRGNPGGRLNAVVEIADELLPEGVVTYTLTKSGTRTEFTSDENHIPEISTVLLVDENSASASEILAGALRDYGAATLVGTTTFGKGIVQTTYSMYDQTAVKITMARYYTPNGDYIHGKGIAPDVEVRLEKGDDLEKVRLTEADTQLEKAMALIKEGMES